MTSKDNEDLFEGDVGRRRPRSSQDSASLFRPPSAVSSKRVAKRQRAAWYNRARGAPNVKLAHERPAGQQRVIIKLKPVAHAAGGGGALMRHALYVERDGAGREGDPVQVFDRELDRADGAAFVDAVQATLGVFDAFVDYYRNEPGFRAVWFDLGRASRLRALDVGASTGGFTDVLLQRGAAAVCALDVGHNQLAWKLRQDARVVSIEGANARHLDEMALPFSPDVVVCDVSFISQTLILPRLVAAVGPGGRPIITLIKPQFEVDKGQVGKGGVVRERALHEQAIARCTQAAEALGCRVIGVTDSPLRGPAGNEEFLFYLQSPP